MYTIVRTPFINNHILSRNLCYLLNMTVPSAYLYPIPIFFLRDAYFYTSSKQQEEVWGLNKAGVHFLLIAS